MQENVLSSRIAFRYIIGEPNSKEFYLVCAERIIQNWKEPRQFPKHIPFEILLGLSDLSLGERPDIKDINRKNMENIVSGGILCDN